MPGTDLILAEHVLRAIRGVRRVRPRTGIYVLIGLTVSGWMGFLALAGVLSATRSATTPEFEPGAPKNELAETEAPKDEVSQKFVTTLHVEPEVASPPVPATNTYELTAYAERQRVEEWIALAQGEQYLARGSIQVARQYFQRAADAGLAAAALRLATTYDPAELQRLEVPGVVPDRNLARKWYERARELGAPGVEPLLARLRADFGERHTAESSAGYHRSAHPSPGR